MKSNDEQETYQMIAMDPPWPERGGGRIKRGADRHYEVVDYRDMPLVVRDQPLWRPDQSGCMVMCWTTVSSCERAYWLLRILKIKPVSKMYWLKDRDGRFGLGQYTRHSIEEVIVGKIGKFPPPKLAEHSHFVAPVGRHSEKPAEAYHLFERMARASGLRSPYAELFAREQRTGWHVCGNEV